MAKSLTSHRPLVGITLKVIAIGLFTIMSGLIKEITYSVPTGQVVFFRSFFVLPVILVWLALRGDLPKGLRTKSPILHFWRGLVGTSAMGLNFAALALLPLPEVTALGYATPIFTLILSALLLGERIRVIRVTAVAVGLIGVLIMLSPRLGSSETLQDQALLGAILVLMAAALRGFVQIHIRKMVQSEETSAIVFYFSVTASLLSLLTLPFGWVMPDTPVLLMMIGTGFLGALAQIIITSSYRYAPASMLAPYDYVSMLFALVIGYVWFAEWPSTVMLAGAAVVIAANAIVIWRESRLGLDRGRAKPLTDPKGG
ncbi:DMT family transporter [Phaeobacter sp. HF9A]|uniref:DMT family transporter n=1 Tax=Phaeobacter sp. HF9A TaxID=2721561 RepID=UPI001430045A|nr:DMT family transporter [Phaeobacter sp. HF9A]NIZ12141.1 DMT family transporter [Phaeobacter sp. HF9A]